MAKHMNMVWGPLWWGALGPGPLGPPPKSGAVGQAGEIPAVWQPYSLRVSRSTVVLRVLLAMFSLLVSVSKNTRLSLYSFLSRLSASCRPATKGCCGTGQLPIPRKF